LSIIGQTSGAYPRVSFKTLGDSVAGRIVAFEDYQCTEFMDDPKRGVKKGDLKFFEKSGDPIMGVKIHLEVVPGDESSRVTLYAEKPRMLKAIASAVKSTGAPDLEEGGDLAVTWSGMDGRAQGYQAAYARPDADSAPLAQAA